MPRDLLRRTLVPVVLLVAVPGPAAASAAPPPAGALVQLAPPHACLANAAVAGCASAGGAFQRPTDVDTTRDGRDVYVANLENGGVVGGRRAPATGALTVNTTAHQGSQQTFGVAVDPGGARVAVASGNLHSGRLALFPRTADGKLGATPTCAVEVAEAGCAEVDGLGGAHHVALPPSGPGI